MSDITPNDTGGFNINIENIKKIIIDNLTDIINHRILRSDDLTVHHLEFINGGKCHLSYRKDGRIVECNIDRLTTQVDLEDGIVMLKIC
jgi:hypothetical protein